MARRKKGTRLPFASRDGPDPKFPLDDEAFTDFETHLGAPLNGRIREELITLCDNYLDGRESEGSWQTYDDVLALMPPLERAAGTLWKMVYEEGLRTDAQSELNAIFAAELAKQPVVIRADRGDLLHIVGEGEAGWVPFQERFQMPAGGYAIALSPRFLQGIAMSLRVAVNLTFKDIQKRSIDRREKDRIGATDVLFLELRRWAKRHDLPFGEYIDGRRPAPFAHFVAGIMARVPEKWWDTGRDTNPTAVAAQIKRARTAWSKTKKGGKLTEPRAA